MFYMPDKNIFSKELFSFLDKPKDFPSHTPQSISSNAQTSPPLSPLQAKQTPQSGQKDIAQKPSGIAIRTMKSDVERLFKTTPPSVAQMISITEPSTPAMKRERKVIERYVTLGIFILILVVIGGGVFYFRAVLFAPQETLLITKAPPPAPFFATEASRTIAVPLTDRQQFLGLMTDTMKEFEREGTIKRILMRFTDTPKERFATMAEFLQLYHIKPLDDLIARIDRPFMAFVHSTSEGTRFGMATYTNDQERTLRDMIEWEPKMITDVAPLFFGKAVTPVTIGFEDRSFRNIDWRYLKLSSTSDIGIGYAIFPAQHLLIITTSKGLMETAINRLFEAG